MELLTKSTRLNLYKAILPGTTRFNNCQVIKSITLFSPGFPKAYSSNLRCVYKLSAPLNANLVIQINVVELDLLGTCKLKKL